MVEGRSFLVRDVLRDRRRKDKEEEEVEGQGMGRIG